MAAARMTSVVTWVTNVFEAATATSGPACRNRTASASRVIAEPTVLVTAMIGQPRSRASRVGAMVSAVSPDWVTAMTSVVLVERRRAVAELRADGGPGRQPGPVLDGRRPDERRVVGAAAGDQLDPGDRPQGRLEPDQLVDGDPVVAVDPAGDRLAQRFGLLVDLLEHEMLVAALLGGLGRPVDGRDRALDRRAGDVGDGDAPRPDVGHVAVLEEDDLVGVGEDGRDIRGEEALAVAEADDERHVLPGADQPIALADVHDHDGVGALEPGQRVADGVGQVAPVGLLDEVGDRLGVGLGGQRVAAGLEPVAQLAEVLDDAVVDDRDLAGAVAVRVGVEVVRPAVGRPARVGEADRGVRRPVGDGGLEVDQLAGPLLHEQVAPRRRRARCRPNRSRGTRAA